MNATTFVDIMRTAGYDTVDRQVPPAKYQRSLPTIGMPMPIRAVIAGTLARSRPHLVNPWRDHQELRSTWINDANFALTLPYYGFSHVELAVGHGDEVVGHYGRWLNARRADADSLRGDEKPVAG